VTLAAFRILGLPASQGSKSFMGMVTGKRGQQIPRLVESSKELPKWRKEVTKQAALAWRGKEPLDHPLVVAMTFTLPKPKSAPKTRRTWPDRKPDVSKLARAVEDSMTDAGVWADDARIVDLIARKRYPGEGSGALPAPGVLVHVFDALTHEADVFAMGAEQPVQTEIAA
jgi:crossover junction endodeoxyribonuclease RusA